MFYRNGQADSKIHMELQRTQKSKTTLKNKNKVGLTCPDFKTYYKASVIKAMWYWHVKRHTDQGNRFKSPEINPCLCQLISEKGTKTIQCGKEYSFQ